MSTRRFNHFKHSTPSATLLPFLESKSPGFARKAIEVAVEKLFLITIDEGVRQEQQARAKQATKSAILMNLESRMDLKLKICRGASIRKILVREAKSYAEIGCFFFPIFCVVFLYCNCLKL